MNQNKGIGLLVILFSLFLFFISGEAQEKKGSGKGGEKALKTDRGFGFTASRAPIDITSDTVEARPENRTRSPLKGMWSPSRKTRLSMPIPWSSLTIPNTKKLKEIVADRECEGRAIGSQGNRPEGYF